MLTQEQIDIIREGPLYFLESIWFRIRTDVWPFSWANRS